MSFLFVYIYCDFFFFLAAFYVGFMLHHEMRFCIYTVVQIQTFNLMQWHPSFDGCAAQYHGMWPFRFSFRCYLQSFKCTAKIYPLSTRTQQICGSLYFLHWSTALHLDIVSNPKFTPKMVLFTWNPLLSSLFFQDLWLQLRLYQSWFRDLWSHLPLSSIWFFSSCMLYITKSWVWLRELLHILRIPNCGGKLVEATMTSNHSSGTIECLMSYIPYMSYLWLYE